MLHLMFLMLKLLQILLEDQNLDYFILPIHVLHYAYVLNYYINRMIRKKHRSKAKCPYLFLSPKRIFCAFMCWRLYVGSGKEAYNIRCEKQKLSGDQDHVLWHVVHMFISFANRYMYNAVFFNLPSFSDN